MTILAGIGALIGTGVIQLTKLIIVDAPSAIAAAGTIFVAQMGK